MSAFTVSGSDFGSFSFGDVKLVLDQAALDRLLNSPQGPVAKELLRAAVLVEAEAKKLLSNQMVNVRTGRLRASTVSAMTTIGGKPVAVVGSGAKYGIYVHAMDRPYLTTAAANVGLRVRAR